MTSKIKNLIELAETAVRYQYNDPYPDIKRAAKSVSELPSPWVHKILVGVNLDHATYIEAACPANLLPILRAAEAMAEALKAMRDDIVRTVDITVDFSEQDISTVMNCEQYKKLREALAEWEKVNK